MKKYLIKSGSRESPYTISLPPSLLVRQGCLHQRLSDLKSGTLCLQGISGCFLIRPSHTGQGRPRYRLGSPTGIVLREPNMYWPAEHHWIQRSNSQGGPHQRVYVCAIPSSQRVHPRPHSCRSLCLTVELSEQRWTKRVPAAVRARSSWSS